MSHTVSIPWGRAGVLRSLIAKLNGAPTIIFLRELAFSPHTVGAPWPSSRRLAEAMAARISPPDDGWVVELGAGTGVVTRALLNRGVAADRLCVIERSAAFAAHMQRRFPEVCVLCGDAAQLGSLLSRGMLVDTIVSSLPLRSLPQDDVSAVVAAWRHALLPGQRVVQFTYALHEWRAGAPFHGFARDRDDIVWRNIPPARVMVLVRRLG